MIVVQLMGGLGSQMSQYAYALKLKSLGYEVRLDQTLFASYRLHSYELDKFNINVKLASKTELKKFRNNEILPFFTNLFLSQKFSQRVLRCFKIPIYNKNVIIEKSHVFNKDFLNLDANKYVIGDFKSEKYFVGMREKLLSDFKYNKPYSNYFKFYDSLIRSENNSCCIHVRRGDFANNKKVNRVHGTCAISYYENAINYINKRIENVKFFVFSNDLIWCKENLSKYNVIFMENNERNDPHEDLILMSQCRNHIIDHSAFCWWGAWLTENKDQIVLAPDRWFNDDRLNGESKDIYCQSWIKIES